MNATLPQWCADIISSPPRSGEGFHNWLFRAARALWKCGRDENDIREILKKRSDHLWSPGIGARDCGCHSKFKDQRGSASWRAVSTLAESQS
jgi:hypothetical protein